METPECNGNVPGVTNNFHLGNGNGPGATKHTHESNGNVPGNGRNRLNAGNGIGPSIAFGRQKYRKRRGGRNTFTRGQLQNESRVAGGQAKMERSLPLKYAFETGNNLHSTTGREQCGFKAHQRGPSRGDATTPKEVKGIRREDIPRSSGFKYKGIGGALREVRQDDGRTSITKNSRIKRGIGDTSDIEENESRRRKQWIVEPHSERQYVKIGPPRQNPTMKQKEMGKLVNRWSKNQGRRLLRDR